MRGAWVPGPEPDLYAGALFKGNEPGHAAPDRGGLSGDEGIGPGRGLSGEAGCRERGGGSGGSDPPPCGAGRDVRGRGSALPEKGIFPGERAGIPWNGRGKASRNEGENEGGAVCFPGGNRHGRPGKYDGRGPGGFPAGRLHPGIGPDAGFFPGLGRSAFRRL